MESSVVKAPHHDKSDCVRVAVNILPSIQSELLLECSDCVTVTPGEPQDTLSPAMHPFSSSSDYKSAVGSGELSAEVESDGKEQEHSQLLRQKQKSDDAAKRSQEKIQRMKSQKVHLQQKIKQESEQFRSWKASREKEVLQLKKECRRNEYEMHKLLALNQRQKMVLQRKTEEASLATRRLKELLEAKKASSRESSGNASGPGMQALMQTIEHDIEVILRVHEVRSKYERQLEARAAMANELIKLKDDAEALRKNTSGCTQTMSPSARNSRISALENMIAVSSSTLVPMASHLSEAEERERLFSGKNRWNQVRSLAEAKNLLNYLFDIVTSSRCQLLDRDVTCFEKDSTIKELTEKVVRLTSLLSQSEVQKIEFQQKLQKLELEMQSTNVIGSLGSLASNSVEAGHIYELRKASRRFQFFHGAGYSSLDIHEVMDTSDSDLDKDWVESGKKLAERRFSGANRSEKAASAGSHIQEENLDVPAVAVQMEGKPDSESFCFCTKSSKCKTQNCRCRATNRICGKSCGCVPRKCVNRRKNKAFVDLKMVDESTELAAHGAMGLRSAFSMNAAGEEVQQRRPLSDIGNAMKLELEMHSSNVIGSLGSLAPNSDIADLEVDDEDWVESGKKLTKRRFKGANRSEKAASAGSHLQEENLDVPAVAVQMEGKPDSKSFCFCTTSSKCKTRSCRCRVTNRMCGKSCGCRPHKCGNRGKNNAFVDLEMADKSTELAAHGAMRLRSAFSMNAA